MASEGTSINKAQTAPDPDDPKKPDSPSDLPKRSWRYTAKTALREFFADQCTDQAAALTYYAVLAIFPALLALISLLGIFGQGESTVNAMLDMVRSLGQQNAAQVLEEPVRQMVTAQGAGIGLVVGLGIALWSASGYIGAFGRALNRVYEVDEGRPIWKLRPLQLFITLICVIAVALALMAIVVSGPVARAIGDTLGVGEGAVTAFNIVKWPVILAVVIVVVALLYYATPNVRQPKFHWISVGAAIGIGVWLLASAAFGFYVSNFGSYNKTYGSLA
ncbi:MAG: YihY/virulence factor BrkB family protein, partial [Dermatophilaceae bacterium]